MKKFFVFILLTGIFLLTLPAFGTTDSPTLAVSVSLNTPSVDAAKGESITATVTASGGTGSYEYNFVWLVTENGIEEPAHAETIQSNASSFTPKHGSTGRVAVVVRDLNGQDYGTAEQTFSITGVPQPLGITVKFDKTSVKVGEPIKATWTVTGGTPPYEPGWGYWIIKEANGNEIQDSFRIIGSETIFVPIAGVTAVFHISFNDSLGKFTEFESDPVTITGAPATEPFTALLALDKSEVRSGESITVSWSYQGGTEPYKFHYYRFYSVEADGTETLQQQGYPQSDTQTHIVLTPKAGVEGYVSIEAFDAAGRELREHISPVFKILGNENIQPLRCEITLSKSEVNVGETITANWTISGGTAPYTYDWYGWNIFEENGKGIQWIGEPPIQGTSDSLLVKLGVSGYFGFQLIDTDGRSIDVRTTEFTIKGATSAPPITGYVTLDKQSVPMGGVFIATAHIQGGTPPYSIKLHLLTYGEDGSVWWQDDEELATTKAFIARDGVGTYVNAYVEDTLGRFVQISSEAIPITPEEPVERQSGDANDDNVVDILDLVSIIDYIVSKTFPASPANADANGDGTVDILDLVWIIDQIVGE
jgi:hypothetical protein